MPIILAYTASDSHSQTFGTLGTKDSGELVFFGEAEVSIEDFCKNAWKHVRASKEEVEYLGFIFPAKDFVAAINYVLTCTDLQPKDPRPVLVEKIKTLKAKKGKKAKPGPWGVLVLSVPLLKKMPGQGGSKSRRLGKK